MINISKYLSSVETYLKDGHYPEEGLLKFTVPGKPIAKGRPRSYAIGGKGGKPFKGIRNVTPKRTVRYESIVRQEARDAMEKAGLKPLQERAIVLIKAFWAWPKSMFRKTNPRTEALHPAREDWDNVGKSLCDSVNAICYLDDKQIVISGLGKFRAAQGEPDRAEFWIASLDNEWRTSNA
jgi:Holliday junction resolvase RusA-like endonuclease